MASYQIKVRDKSGNILGEFQNWLSLTFSKKLNGVGECSFSVPTTDTKLLTLTSLRNYETLIYRDKTLVWAGEQAYRQSNLTQNGLRETSVHSYTFLEQLNQRFTAAIKTFSATDAGQIAWTLINDSQTLTDGDYGITQGSIPATVNRDRTYEYKNVMEAIIQLTEVLNGFDFEITDSKVFNVFARKGNDLSQSIVLEWGTNIESLGIDEDFKTPTNEAIVLGSGFGSAQNTAVYTDTSYRSINKLRQQRVSYTDVIENVTLTDKGTAIVNQSRQPIISVSLKQLSNTYPSFQSFTLGDTIRLVVKEGIFAIDTAYRAYGHTVTVDRNNKESIEYLISTQ